MPLLEELIAQREPPVKKVVLPIASIENHGCLPIGTDLILARCVINKLVDIKNIKNSVWIAPIIPYSTSIEHLSENYTISSSTITFIEYLKEIITTLAEFSSQVILLVFHGGAYYPAYMAAREERSQGRDVRVINFWRIIEEALRNKYSWNNPVIVHASSIEASILASCNYIEECMREVDKVEEEISELLEPWIGMDIEYVYKRKIVSYSKKIGKELLEYALNKITEIITA